MARTPSRGRSVRWLARSYAEVISAMNQGWGPPAMRPPDQRCERGTRPGGTETFPADFHLPRAASAFRSCSPLESNAILSFDPRKIHNPPNLLPASGAGFRARATGCGLRVASEPNPGGRLCAQLEDSAGRELRSAPAAAKPRLQDAGVPVVPKAPSPGIGCLVCLLVVVAD